MTSLKVALYLRISSDMQLDNYSIEAQENACRAFAGLRGWRIVARYADLAYSASTDQRAEFQRMIADARAGDFEVVLVYKLDRFSRNLIDTLNYLSELQASEVALTSATEQFDYTTPSGRLFLTMLGALAEWYRNNLSEEVRKGKVQRAKSGDWNGTLSWGYTTPRLLRARLLKEPEHAELI